MYFTAITSCSVINRILHVWWNGALVATLSTSHSHITWMYTHSNRKQWTRTIAALNQHLYLFYREFCFHSVFTFQPFNFVGLCSFVLILLWNMDGKKGTCMRLCTFWPWATRLRESKRASEKKRNMKARIKYTVQFKPVLADPENMGKKEQLQNTDKNKEKRRKRRSKQKRYLKN